MSVRQDLSRVLTTAFLLGVTTFSGVDADAFAQETFSFSDQDARRELPRIDDSKVFKLLVEGMELPPSTPAARAVTVKRQPLKVMENPHVVANSSVTSRDEGDIAMPSVRINSPVIATSSHHVPVPVLPQTEYSEGISASSYAAPEGIGNLTGQSELFDSLWGKNDANEAEFRHVSQSPGFAMAGTVRTTVDPMAGERLVNGQIYTWASPAQFHNPLIFEQVNLERYGIGPAPIFQPAISAAHFFGNIARLPYHAVATPACEKIYIFGHHRPGNCVPYQYHRSRKSWKAFAVQGLATCGAVGLLSP